MSYRSSTINISGGSPGTFTSLTVTGMIKLDAASGFTDFGFLFNGLNRWIFEREGAEGGGNSGSNLYLYRYDDNGIYLGKVFDFNRATGAVGVQGYPLAITGIQTITANSSSAALDVVQNGAGIGTRIRPGTDQTLALVIDKAGSTASRLRMFVGNGSDGYTADDPYFWSNNADIHFRTGIGGITEALVLTASGGITMPNIPTSSAGLPAGGLWNDSGTIKIV